MSTEATLNMPHLQLYISLQSNRYTHVVCS